MNAVYAVKFLKMVNIYGAWAMKYGVKSAAINLTNKNRYYDIFRYYVLGWFR